MLKLTTPPPLNNLPVTPGFCCELCRGPLSSGGICPGCLNDLPQILTGCKFCGIPLQRDGVCGRCMQRKPGPDRMVGAYSYIYPVDIMIKNIKYKQRLNSLPPLASRLAEKIKDTGPVDIELIVPVPMHRGRMAGRGMNQAVEVARIISKLLDIPCDLYSLKRTRKTAPMHDLDPKQRNQNVRGAFAWGGPHLPESIAIIDDVITSGATCNEISRCLKSSGISHIEAWALARAS